MLKTFLALSILIGIVASQDPDAPKNIGQDPDAPKNSTCGQASIDLVFVVDVSGSVTLPNFNRMMDAIRATAKGLSIGPNDDQTHIGLVTFSSSATKIFGLNDHLSNEDLDKALSQVPYTEGGTNITSGMIEALAVFAEAANRPSVPDVMVVITDGQDGSNVRDAHQQAEDKGIVVFAVGVGNSNNLDMNQLEVVAGSSDNVFVSTNFSFLQRVLQDKVCSSIVEAIKPATTQAIFLDASPRTEAPPHVEFNCEGINEVFDECGGCEATCGDFSNTCMQKCDVKNARCRCQSGFFRHSNGSCVTPDTCCPEGEVFDACGGCEERCGERRLNCIDGCDFNHARCRCRRGLARNEIGHCIARDGCVSRQSNFTCGINEVRRCSTSCEGTCGNRQPSCIFNAPTRPRCRFQRCECPVENGFVRDHFGRCFHSSLCPQIFPPPGFNPNQQLQNPASTSDGLSRPNRPQQPAERPQQHGFDDQNSQRPPLEEPESGNSDQHALHIPAKIIIIKPGKPSSSGGFGMNQENPHKRPFTDLSSSGSSESNEDVDKMKQQVCEGVGCLEGSHCVVQCDRHRCRPSCVLDRQ